MPPRSPQALVLFGIAALLFAMIGTEGTLTMLPGLLLMTAGGLWEALRGRTAAPRSGAPVLPVPPRRVSFGNGELRQSRT